MNFKMISEIFRFLDEGKVVEVTTKYMKSKVVFKKVNGNLFCWNDEKYKICGFVNLEDVENYKIIEDLEKNKIEFKIKQWIVATDDFGNRYLAKIININKNKIEYTGESVHGFSSFPFINISEPKIDDFKLAVREKFKKYNNILIQDSGIIIRKNGDFIELGDNDPLKFDYFYDNKLACVETLNNDQPLLLPINETETTETKPVKTLKISDEVVKPEKNLEKKVEKLFELVEMIIDAQDFQTKTIINYNRRKK